MTLSLYAALIVLSIWIGGLIPLFTVWSETVLRYTLAFGAGVILGAIFLHIFPDAIAVIGASASMYALLGFLAIYLVERFMMVHACEEEAGCDFHTVGMLSFLGFSMHSFLSGVALGSSFLIPSLGFVVFIALLVHKAPESFSLVTILIRGGHTRPNIFRMLLFFSLMIPVGAYFAVVALRYLNHEIVGAAVAFTAGSFLHIAFSDLLPEMHRSTDNRFVVLGVFLLGLVAMASVKGLGI